MTEQELDERFAQILKERNALNCPECGRALTREDISLLGSENEEGEEFSMFSIVCDCGADIMHSSWGTIEDTEELLNAIDADWG